MRIASDMASKLVITEAMAVLCLLFLAIAIAVDSDVLSYGQMEEVLDEALVKWKTGKWEEAAKMFEGVMLKGQSPRSSVDE